MAHQRCGTPRGKRRFRAWRISSRTATARAIWPWRRRRLVVQVRMRWACGRHQWFRRLWLRRRNRRKTSPLLQGSCSASRLRRQLLLLQTTVVRCEISIGAADMLYLARFPEDDSFDIGADVLFRFSRGSYKLSFLFSCDRASLEVYVMWCSG